ncbi:MAG: carbohydrate binding domain-containing protein, partial [Chloroflexi bacterium]|nr:carbohydrate binding domain-containing protein [Chloroflexota bacterium]
MALRPLRTSMVAALVILLISVMPAAGRDASARPDAPINAAAPRGVGTHTVSGDCVATDCLDLTVNAADGGVDAVTEGTRAIPMNGKKGGFSVRMVGDQPNMLLNHDFEDPSGGWTFPTSGSYRPVRAAESDMSHPGSWVSRVQISGTTPRTSAALMQQTRTVSPSTNYVISGWFKTTALGPNSTETTAPLTYKPGLAPAAVRIEMLDASSNVLRTNWVYAYTGTAQWHENAVGVKTLSNVNRIRLSVGVWGGYGTVMFDDISLSRLFPTTNTPLPMTATQPGGGNTPILLTGTVGSGQPLRVNATVSPTSKGFEIEGAVTNTSGTASPSTDRALQLSYTLPINATGWQWGDTPRVSRTIVAGSSYFFENNLNSPTARYPWATVFDSGPNASGLSIGAPLTRPRAYALKY